MLENVVSKLPFGGPNASPAHLEQGCWAQGALTEHVVLPAPGLGSLPCKTEAAPVVSLACQLHSHALTQTGCRVTTCGEAVWAG